MHNVVQHPAFDIQRLQQFILHSLFTVVHQVILAVHSVWTYSGLKTGMKASLSAKTVDSLIPAAKPYEVRDTRIKGFLLRVQPSGAMVYYLSYTPPSGRRQRYRIGAVGNLTPAQARDIAEELAGHVAHGVDIHTQKKAARIEGDKAKVRLLRGFLEHKYRPWVVAERKTGDEMLQRIQFNFRDLLDRPLCEITQWVAEKWRAEQLKRGKSKATVNRDMAALRAALSKAVEWGLIDIHPLAKLRPIKGDRLIKVRYLSYDEEDRLRGALAARNDRLKAVRTSANDWRRERGYELYPDLTGCIYADHLTPMVVLSLNTGLRRGEVFSLTWNSVNFQTKTLTVEGTTAKSGQTRHIPLNDEALDVLRQWRNPTNKEALVFPGKNGTRLNNVRKSWAGALKMASIIGFRWHDLRHDFASKLVMAGVPLNTVRDLLGHADLTTTLRYAHLAPDHRAQAVALLRKAEPHTSDPTVTTESPRF